MIEKLKDCVIAVIIAILLLLALSGCATTALVPTYVACDVEEPLPSPLRFSPPYDNVYDAVRHLLGDREVMAAQQERLVAALRVCTMKRD